MAETNFTASDSIVERRSNGTITFASDVISTIAGLAAMDIPGVAGMSGGFVDGIVDLLGRKNFSKGIKVEVGNEEVALDIGIVVTYGTPITEVAKNIQDSVKKAVETMTGLRVVEVNVTVQGIQVDEKQLPSGVKPTGIAKIKQPKAPAEPPRVK